MADDFFADLLPMRPRVAVSNGEVGRAPSATSHEARQEPPAVASARAAELPDLLSPDPKEEQKSGVDLQALSAKQLQDFESAVESTMRRFASGLKIVLEDIHKRVGAMETKLGDIDAKVQDSRELEKVQGLGLKDRLEVWDKSLKDMQQGIQLIRDKQELLDAQAELAQLKKLEEVKKQEEAKKAQEAKAAVDSTLKPSQAPAAPTPAPDAPPPTPVSVPPATPAPSVASQLSVDPPRPVPQDPTPTPSAPSAPLAPQPPTPFQQQSQAAPQSMPTTHSSPYTGGAGQQQYSPAPQMSQGYPPHAPQQSQQQSTQAPAHYASVPQQQQQYPQPSQPPPTSSYQHPPQAQQPLPSQSSQYQGPPAPQRYNSTPQPQSQPQPQPQTYSNYSSNTGSSQYNTAPYASNYGPPNKTSSGYPTLPHSQPSFPQHHQQGSSYSSGPSSGHSSGHYSGAQPSYRLPQTSHAPSNNYQRPSRPPAPPSGEAAPRDFPLEQVIDDVCNMGFSRHEVRAAVAELTDKGQAVDLNVLLDRLMNGPRR